MYDDLAYDFNAFFDLNSSRQAGFSIGSIPLSEIYVYMQIRGIDDPQERLIFLRRIQILDNEYLKITNEKKNG